MKIIQTSYDLYYIIDLRNKKCVFQADGIEELEEELSYYEDLLGDNLEIAKVVTYEK